MDALFDGVTFAFNSDYALTWLRRNGICAAPERRRVNDLRAVWRHSSRRENTRGDAMARAADREVCQVGTCVKSRGACGACAHVAARDWGRAADGARGEVPGTSRALGGILAVHDRLIEMNLHTNRAATLHVADQS